MISFFGLVLSRYLISYTTQHLPDDDIAEGSSSTTRGNRKRDGQDGYERTSGPQRKYMTKEEKKATRGANKNRRFAKTRDEVDLCWRVANGSDCDHGE